MLTDVENKSEGLMARVESVDRLDTNNILLVNIFMKHFEQNLFIFSQELTNNIRIKAHGCKDQLESRFCLNNF